MAILRMLFAKMRYPMPKEGDFTNIMPLDKYLADDGDDNLAKNKRKPVPRKKPK